MSKNDVTGDNIYTKPSRKFEENYSGIFRQDTCDHCGKFIRKADAEHYDGGVYHRWCIEEMWED